MNSWFGFGFDFSAEFFLILLRELGILTLINIPKIENYFGAFF